MRLHRFFPWKSMEIYGNITSWRKFGRPNTTPTPQSKMWARIWPRGRMLLDAGPWQPKDSVDWWENLTRNPRFLHVFTSKCQFLFLFVPIQFWDVYGFLDCLWNTMIPTHWYPWRSRYDESEWYLATPHDVILNIAILRWCAFHRN